jgi:hypothetical protein
MFRDPPDLPAFDHITTLRPTGAGRFFEAAFLLVWLVFWIVGETGAIVLGFALIASLLARAAGVPMPSFLPAVSLTPHATWLGLLAVFVWLLFWTVGGVAAISQLFRGLFGADVLRLTTEGDVEITRRTGPFARRRTITGATLRDVRIRPHDKMLVLDTTTGERDVTRFGRPADRERLCLWLRRRITWPEPSHAARLDAAIAPPGWTLEGEGEGNEVRLMRMSNATRLKQVRVAWSVTIVLACGWLSGVSDGMTTASGLLLGITVLAAIGSTWLTWGRVQWLVRAGHLSRRTQFARWMRERSFVDGTLDITTGTDGDGDRYFTLAVRSPEGRLKLAGVTHDSYELDRLASWLAARTGFPVDGLRD